MFKSATIWCVRVSEGYLQSNSPTNWEQVTRPSRYMLKCIRASAGSWDEKHQLNGVIDINDTYLGGPQEAKSEAVSQKRRGFLLHCLDSHRPSTPSQNTGHPNIKQASVRKFSRFTFVEDYIIRGIGYFSYIPVLRDFSHEHKTYESRPCLKSRKD